MVTLSCAIIGIAHECGAKGERPNEEGAARSAQRPAISSWERYYSRGDGRKEGRNLEQSNTHRMRRTGSYSWELS